MSGRSRFKGRRAESSPNAAKTASVFLALIRSFCSEYSADGPAPTAGELHSPVATFSLSTETSSPFYHDGLDNISGTEIKWGVFIYGRAVGSELRSQVQAAAKGSQHRTEVRRFSSALICQKEHAEGRAITTSFCPWCSGWAAGKGSNRSVKSRRRREGMSSKRRRRGCGWSQEQEHCHF